MLFNKDNKGSIELYEISGTFQAATPFSAIATEVQSAQMDVRSIVGDDVISQAETIYNNANPSDSDKEYLNMVRRPIAFLAICNYSKITGLQHGVSGRKMVVGENEKVPFEWMIDRDDREMRERYYRAMDTLFGYLNTSGPASWKTSEIYKRSQKSLVPDLKTMETVYPVEHSQYTFYMLVPLMLEAQEKLLKEMGDDASGYLEADSKILPAARRFVVLKALVIALRRWAISVFPTEVARQFAPSYQGNREKQVATTDEIEWAIGKLEAQAKEAEAEILEEVKGNPYSGFPLVPENDPRNKYFTV